MSNCIIYSLFINRLSTQSFLVVYNTDKTEVFLQKCSAKQMLFQSPMFPMFPVSSFHMSKARDGGTGARCDISLRVAIKTLKELLTSFWYLGW